MPSSTAELSTIALTISTLCFALLFAYTLFYTRTRDRLASVRTFHLRSCSQVGSRTPPGFFSLGREKGGLLYYNDFVNLVTTLWRVFYRIGASCKTSHLNSVLSNFNAILTWNFSYRLAKIVVLCANDHWCSTS